MVSGKVGVLIIGIGIIIAVLVAPRGVLTPQKVTGFLGTFGLPTAQAETEKKFINGTPVIGFGGVTEGALVNGIAGGQFAPMVSPKPVSEKLQTQITTTIPTQTPTIIQPKAIPIDPTVTTPEERALVESEIARLKAEAGISSVTIDPTTGKQSFNIFLRETL